MKTSTHASPSSLLPTTATAATLLVYLQHLHLAACHLVQYHKASQVAILLLQAQMRLSSHHRHQMASPRCLPSSIMANTVRKPLLLTRVTCIPLMLERALTTCFVANRI
jgi:hypothetical protein